MPDQPEVPRNPPIRFTKLAALVGYLSYFGGHVVFGALVLPLFVALTPFERLRWRFLRGVFNWYVRFLSHRYLCWLRVYRFKEISGRERAIAAGPAVYMINHRSRMDGPIMLAAVPGSAVVIKGSYGRNVLYSSFVKYLDFIPVEPGALQSLAAAMEQAKRLLASGRSILIFPEGTRAPTGRLLPFKDIGLRLARETGAPIIPVVLHSDLPFMAKRPGSIFPPRTINFTVRFLEPLRITPEDRLGPTLAKVEEMMAEQLRELDKGTVWEVGGRGR